MIRTIKLVYDPSQKGLSNLDDRIALALNDSLKVILEDLVKRSTNLRNVFHIVLQFLK